MSPAGKQTALEGLAPPLAGRYFQGLEPRPRWSINLAGHPREDVTFQIRDMAENVTSHQRRAFAERLERAPLLLDGAMGTLLFSRGVPQRSSLDELVETRPDLVGAIHREYIDAGADAIETNSFGANRIRLAPFGLADKAALLNRKAAQLAREARDVAGRRDVLIAGSIGPLEAPLHGPDAHKEATIRTAFREQIEGLLEGGV